MASRNGVRLHRFLTLNMTRRIVAVVLRFSMMLILCFLLTGVSFLRAIAIDSIYMTCSLIYTCRGLVNPLLDGVREFLQLSENLTNEGAMHTDKAHTAILRLQKRLQNIKSSTVRVGVCWLALLSVTLVTADVVVYYLDAILGIWYLFSKLELSFAMSSLSANFLQRFSCRVHFRPVRDCASQANLSQPHGFALGKILQEFAKYPSTHEVAHGNTSHTSVVVRWRLK